MGQIKTYSITCSKCKYVGNIAVSDTVNIDSTTDNKEKIMKRLFFKFRCPECKNDFQAEYPVLFESLENNVLLYFVPKADEKKLEKVKNLAVSNDFGKKMRIINNQNELVEKLLIFDDGYDDIIIEYLKTVIEKSVAKEQKEKMKDLYYSGMRGDSLLFVVPLKDGTYNVNIPKSMYMNYYSKYNIKESFRFIKVDRTNVENFMF